MADPESFSDMFAAQGKTLIDWQGPLYGLYEFPCEVSRLTVEFLASNPDPVQGIRFKVRGGELQVNGAVSADVVLWADTVPASVHLSIGWKRTERSLRMWNVWRVNGVAHAWVGNAGMRLEDLNEGVLGVHCSDGVGPPDFDDLVLQVQYA